MHVRDFDYHLPPERIAQTPVEPRDAARLLVLRRDQPELEHRIFRDLPLYLRPGDALVLNDTKVMPARLVGERAGSGGRVEFLLLKRLGQDTWETLVKPGRKARPGATVVFGGGRLEATVLDTTAAGGRIVAFRYNGLFEQVLEELGRMPLPPYITAELSDPDRYQTVYAREWGSAAAPTAGLHFTPGLLERIRNQGVQVVFLTLHVGLGTFRPVQVEEVEAHRMHAEYYEVTPAAAAALNGARAAGARIIPVGTTALRTLESVTTPAGVVEPGSGWTDIFIYPGYRFRATDALVTNFHLPRSTLLMLVSALAGRERILAAYAEAIRHGYRFFSFGDAMLIL